MKTCICYKFSYLAPNFYSGVMIDSFRTLFVVYRGKAVISIDVTMNRITIEKSLKMITHDEHQCIVVAKRKSVLTRWTPITPGCMYFSYMKNNTINLLI